MSATWLADALRAGGCTVDETVVPDWKQRGHTDGGFTPVGVLGHHTAGAKTGNLPSLAIVRDGRPDLDGPLANLMLSRAGVFVPIAAGRAWHAGAATYPGNYPWVPNGDGNGYLIGIEAESCGTVDDWTDEQRAAYPLGVAALLRHMNAPASHFLGHKEWAVGRKIDPAFLDMASFRATVAAHLTDSQGDDLTPAQAQQLAFIFNALGGPAGGIGDVVTSPDDVTKRDLRSLGFLAAYARSDAWRSADMLVKLTAQVAALNAAVAALGKPGGVTAAQIQQAATAGAQAALKDLGGALSAGK